MGKNLMRVIAVAMLFVMMAAAASAATVTVASKTELETALADADSGDTIKIQYGDYGTVPFAVSNKNIIIEGDTDESSMELPSPFLTLNSSVVTLKGIKTQSSFEQENPVLIAFEQGQSTVTLDNCSIEWYRSGVESYPYCGSLAQFNSNGNTLIFAKDNVVYTLYVASYGEGVQNNLVKVPEGNDYSNYIEPDDGYASHTSVDRNGNGTIYNHTALKKVEAKEPTCAEKGWEEYWTCDGCRFHYTDSQGKYMVFDSSKPPVELDKDYDNHPVQLTYTPGKEATCTEDGVREYYYCSACECKFADEEGTDTIYSNELVIKAAHKSKIHVEKEAASATKHGVKEHYKCDACGGLYKYSSMEEKDKYNGPAEVILHNTEYEYHNGKKLCVEVNYTESFYRCTVCNQGFKYSSDSIPLDLDSMAIQPIGHDLDHREYQAATEEYDGWKKHSYCSRCYGYYEDRECTIESAYEVLLIPALSHVHSDVDYYEEEPATDTEAGMRAHYECGDCWKWYWDEACTQEVAKYSDLIIPVGGTGGHRHSGTYQAAKEPTFTEAGMKEHYACSCGELFEDAACQKPTNEKALMIAKLIAVSGNTATVETEGVKAEIEEAVANKAGAVVIPVSDVGNVEKVTIPAEAIEAAADEGLALVFELSKQSDSDSASKETIALDSATLKAIMEVVEKEGLSATDIDIVREKKEVSALNSKQEQAVKAQGAAALVLDLAIELPGGLNIHEFNGGCPEIAVAFDLAPGKNPADYKLYYVDEQGKMEHIDDVTFAKGSMIIRVPHFSSFVLIDTNPTVDAAVTDLPQTGDNSNMMLWMGLLMISACAFVMGKKVRA